MRLFSLAALPRTGERFERFCAVLEITDKELQSFEILVDRQDVGTVFPADQTFWSITGNASADILLYVTKWHLGMKGEPLPKAVGSSWF